MGLLAENLAAIDELGLRPIWSHLTATTITATSASASFTWTSSRRQGVVRRWHVCGDMPAEPSGRTGRPGRYPMCSAHRVRAKNARSTD